MVEAIGFESLYRSLDKHPLTGVRKSHPGPEKRYIYSDGQALSLASKYGKKCEQVALDSWGVKVCGVDPDLYEAGQQIRAKLFQKLSERVYYNNSGIEPFYRELTDPPDIPFPSMENSYPSWEPLTKLFTIIDRKTSSNFINDFINLGESYPNSGKVHKNIKFLVEAALTLERLINYPSPFQKSIVIPNVWIGKSAQFDGVVLDNSQGEPINQSDKLGIKTHIEANNYSVLETKWDARARYITGQSNPLNSRVHPRHIVEVQEKLAKLIIIKNGNFNLPQSVVFCYLRGTQDHIIHKVPLDLKFLSDWKFGIELAKDLGFVEMSHEEGANLLINYLDNRINNLINKQNLSKQKFDNLHRTDKDLKQKSFIR